MIGTTAARDDFERLTGPYRRELLAHCARHLGSGQEAEDLVQETYLRAWRAFDGFEGRASVRSWLYRIATNACLNALKSRGRRPLPTRIGGAEPPDPAFGGVEEPSPGPQLQILFGTDPADPSAVVESRAGLRLALAAAWRHLPARQRTALILCEVLGWRATEAAELLGTSGPAVHSMLQRARAQLARAAPSAEEVAEPGDPCERDLLDLYVDAFETADLAALTRLLTDDAVCEVRSEPVGAVGREAIGRFVASRCPAFGTCEMVRTAHDGRPAFATYVRGADGVRRAHSVEVLTATPAGIARIVSHPGPGLFTALGLPLTRTDAASG